MSNSDSFAVVQSPVSPRIVLGYLDSVVMAMGQVQSELGQNLFMLQAIIDSGLLSPEQVELIRREGRPDSARVANNGHLDSDEIHKQLLSYVNSVNRMDSLIQSLTEFRSSLAEANNETHERLHNSPEFVAECIAQDLNLSRL